MKILLDTHAFLWFIGGDSHLDNHARELIENLNNERYLSIASIWEITVKSSLGRLTVPMPPSSLIREHVWANAIDLLDVLPNHFDTLLELPYLHKDPFDRLIIAQAIAEDLVIVTADQELSSYDVKVAWSSSES